MLFLMGIIIFFENGKKLFWFWLIIKIELGGCGYCEVDLGFYFSVIGCYY